MDSNFFFTARNIDSRIEKPLTAPDGTPLYYESAGMSWNVRKNRVQVGDPFDRGTIVYHTDSILGLAAYLNANEIKPA